MKTKALPMAGLALLGVCFYGAVLASVVHAEVAVRVVEKEFNTQGFAGVLIENSLGNVHIVPGVEGRIRIVAKQIFASASTEAEADALAQSVVLEIAQGGADCVASAHLKDGAKAVRRKQLQVDFEVAIPRECLVDVKNLGAGSVALESVRGAVRVRTQSGSVSIGDVAGVVDVNTESGHIAVRSCSRMASLVSDSGDIEVGPVGGRLEVSTRSGHIRLGALAGVADVTSFRGNISARIAGVVPGDCSLKTSEGNVDVETDPSSALLLDAHSQTGAVYAYDVPMSVLVGGTGKNRYAGRINAASLTADGKRGALVKIRSDRGDIDVKANGVLFEPSASGPQFALLD